MPHSISQSFFRMSGVKPWVALAILVSIVLFGFYLAQGIRYWFVSAEIAEISQDVRGLERKIYSLPDSSEVDQASSVDLDLQLSKLEDLRSLFDYPGTDDLLAIVSSAAADAGLKLLSMRADAPQEEILNLVARKADLTSTISEGSEVTPNQQEDAPDTTPEEPMVALAYDVQPVTIALEGPPENLAQFLTSLQKRVPVVSAPSIRIAGLDHVPTSKFQLLFYLSPHEAPQEDEANANSGDGGSG